MIIRCPRCSARFNLPQEILVVSNRRLRCSRCQEVFHPQAGDAVRDARADPAPAGAGQERNRDDNQGGAVAQRNRQDRIFLQARAELRLKKGLIFYGSTQNLGDDGVTFFPDRGISEVKVGDSGVFSFILEGASKEYFTEFKCEVKILTENAIEIRFNNRDDSPNTTTTFKEKDFDLIRTGATVHVMRHGGKLEGGWEVVPPDAQLPVNIQEVVDRKEPEGTCIVCRKQSKSGENRDMYKVYFMLDLLAIQMAAKKGRVEQ